MPFYMKSFGKRRRYRKADYLFNAQDKADGFYYVESGEIRVFKMDEQGKEVEVARLDPGDFLGEAIVFVSPAFPFFAQAVKDSEVLFFDKETIFQKIEEDPTVAKFFLNLLARKCLTLSNRIESLGLRTVRQKLIQYLLSRCSGELKCRHPSNYRERKRSLRPKSRLQACLEDSRQRSGHACSRHQGRSRPHA